MAQVPSEQRSLILSDALEMDPQDDDLVRDLTGENKQRLLELGKPMSFAKGEHIFRQGEAHNGIYLIQEGIVRSYYVSPNGREFTLAHWSAPSFVGGPQLFGGGEHVWSSVAKTDVATLFLLGANLRSLASEIPALAINLLDGLVGKARYYSVVLQMLGTRSVTQRLAYYLLLHAKDEEDQTGAANGRLSQSDIATIVGSTRQWVSSTLERFRKAGVIEVRENGSITITDRRELTRLAEE